METHAFNPEHWTQNSEANQGESKCLEEGFLAAYCWEIPENLPMNSMSWILSFYNTDTDTLPSSAWNSNRFKKEKVYLRTVASLHRFTNKHFLGLLQFSR